MFVRNTFLPSAVHLRFFSPQAPPEQSLGVFTGVIVIISVGSLIVTLQAKVSISARHGCSLLRLLLSKLLGGRV